MKHSPSSSAPSATSKSSDSVSVEPDPSPFNTLIWYEVPALTLGLGCVVYDPAELLTLSPNVAWKLAPSVRIRDTKSVSPDEGVHLMVLAVEKSHCVFELGTVSSKARLREKRLGRRMLERIVRGWVGGLIWVGAE